MKPTDSFTPLSIIALLAVIFYSNTLHGQSRAVETHKKTESSPKDTIRLSAKDSALLAGTFSFDLFHKLVKTSADSAKVFELVKELPEGAKWTIDERYWKQVEKMPSYPHSLDELITATRIMRRMLNLMQKKQDQWTSSDWENFNTDTSTLHGIQRKMDSILSKQ